jgi:shikimate dehydrogenase
MISGNAKIAGVMGWPVGHSRSPRLHGTWLRHYRVDGAYVPMAVQPHDLERALRALPVLGFRGVNLTLPHKEEALRKMDRVDSLARRVGAVNTVVVQADGSLTGSNTDVFGFQENLKEQGFKAPDHAIATILGAGGAARAVVAALQDMGFQEIRIVNRTREHAERCVEELRVSQSTALTAWNWEKLREALAGTALLVNATPLGMEGREALVADINQLPSTAWVTDIVYTPLMTDLLRQAQQRGCRAVDGLGMLLHQARPGFAAWFGVDPKVTPELREAVLADD